jgi:translocation and assembly module TamA
MAAATKQVPSRPVRVVVCIALSLLTPIAKSADPQPYTVNIAKTNNSTLDQILEDSSTLISLNKTAPVGSVALIARAQADQQRFTAALESQGFYKASIRIKIAGRDLDDPNLDGWLEKAPADPPVQVAVSIEPGPPFHLRKLDIQGDIPGSARVQLGLKTGAPALAADVMAGRERLLNALRNDGYALAKVGEPIATLAPEADALDVAYPVETGPRVELGDITLKGLNEVDESFVRRRLLIAYGDRFDPVAIEKARQDLAKQGVFSAVRVHMAEAVDAQGRLPITLEMTEREKHAVSAEAAWSTDLGGSLATTWQHRNLLGGAEQLNLTAGVTQIGGNSTTGIGYKALAGFVKPDLWQRDQTLRANLGAIKQSLIAYDQKAVLGDVSLERKFADYWIGSVGLAGEQSNIAQEGVTRNYTLLSLPLTIKYDSSNNLLDPTQGIRANASITPVQPLSAKSTSTFVILQMAGSGYFDLGEPGRSVLALRGMVGDVQGADQFDLPPDKRFYAGGSATVRGYKYQSIGPQFIDNKPQGGVSMAAATVEFRQRILDSYGAVVFADAGQVNADGAPFASTWHMGVGVGARYYTGFGPIRLDVAMPVNKQQNSGSFEVYIGLGQAF